MKAINIYYVLTMKQPMCSALYLVIFKPNNHLKDRLNGSQF